MSDLDLDSRPQREFDVRARPHAKAYLLLRVHVTMKTNSVGMEMWKLFDGTNTVEDVAAKLAAEFGAPVEQVRQDALAFVADLLQAQFVKLV
jgi:Coenzyme PQQ synthesis protein D (PqqD)